MAVELISHLEIDNTTTADVTLNSFSGYTDLLILASLRSQRADVTDFLDLYPNGTVGNTTSTYALKTDNGSAGSKYTTDADSFCGYIAGASQDSDIFATVKIYVSDYENVGTHKMFDVAYSLTEDRRAGIIAKKWSNTSALTSITLSPTYDNFAQYSTITLYGITSGSDGVTTVS